MRAFPHFQSMCRPKLRIQFRRGLCSNTLFSEKGEDGKSFVNPPAKKSSAYTSFVHPITNGRRGGFDIHIYFLQTDMEEAKFAYELWERIRRECKSCLKSSSLDCSNCDSPRASHLQSMGATHWTPPYGHVRSQPFHARCVSITYHTDYVD